MTSMIRIDNWLGFRTLWLVFRIRVYGQVLGLGVQCLVLDVGFRLSIVVYFLFSLWIVLYNVLVVVVNVPTTRVNCIKKQAEILPHSPVTTGPLVGLAPPQQSSNPPPKLKYEAL